MFGLTAGADLYSSQVYPDIPRTDVKPVYSDTLERLIPNFRIFAVFYSVTMGLPNFRSVFNARSNDNNKEGNRKHIFPDPARNLLVVVSGEFCGTFMFLLLSFIGTQTALNTNDPSDPSAQLLPFSLLYVAASFGTALAVNVWIFYRVTGGMFNPAVSSSISSPDPE